MTKRQILDKVKELAEDGLRHAHLEGKDRLLSKIAGWCEGVRDEMRGNGKK